MKALLKTAALAALALSLASCSGEQAQTSLEKEKIRGSVKKIELGYHPAKWAEVNGAIAVVMDTAKMDPAYETISSFVYDEKGNNVYTAIVAATGDTLGYQKCVFDDRNNPVEVVIYNDALASTMTQKFRYDRKNRVTEMSYLNANGSVEAIENTTYDDDSLTQTSKYVDASGNLISSYVNKLDERGNVVESSWENGGVGSSHYAAKFDEDGNRTEVLIYGAGNAIESRVVNAYDSLGNVVKQNVLDKDGKFMYAFVYDYEFDSAGNWIRSYEFQLDSLGNPVPTTIMERVIEYY